MAHADAPPSQTIYINNLYEKVKKDDLKKQLYSMFSTYGKILDVVALKTMKMRGQCFIVFDNVQSATEALRAMNGFPFHDKNMRISFARSKSDAVAKLDGSFVEKKRERSERREVEVTAARSLAKRAATGAPAPTAMDTSAPAQTNGAAPAAQEMQQAPAAAAAAAPAAAAAAVPAALQPNKILFVEILPNDCNEMMLSMLFQQFGGFKEARLVPGKSGISFVEFESEMQAAQAMDGLNNFKITPTALMKITYAKK